MVTGQAVINFGVRGARYHEVPWRARRRFRHPRARRATTAGATSPPRRPRGHPASSSRTPAPTSRDAPSGGVRRVGVARGPASPLPPPFRPRRVARRAQASRRRVRAGPRGEEQPRADRRGRGVGGAVPARQGGGVRARVRRAPPRPVREVRRAPPTLLRIPRRGRVRRLLLPPRPGLGESPSSAAAEDRRRRPRVLSPESSSRAAESGDGDGDASAEERVDAPGVLAAADDERRRRPRRQVSSLKTNIHRRMKKMTNPLAEKHRAPTPPPDWSAVFSDPDRPTVVDVGCAKGRFLQRAATSDAERFERDASRLLGGEGGTAEPPFNFLGLEIYEPIVLDALRWTEARYRERSDTDERATLKRDEGITDAEGISEGGSTTGGSGGETRARTRTHTRTQTQTQTPGVLKQTDAGCAGPFRRTTPAAETSTSSLATPTRLFPVSSRAVCAWTSCASSSPTRGVGGSTRAAASSPPSSSARSPTPRGPGRGCTAARTSARSRRRCRR